MDRGHVKLWRKSLDSGVFASEQLWKVWCWCLMRTNYKQRNVSFQTGKGGVVITVNPGQFVFGRNAAADQLCQNPSTVWKRMKKLESLGMIQIESNNQYSIVSICNWSEYQSNGVEKEQAGNKQVTSKEQASNTDKKDKKDKNKEKDILSGKAQQRIPFAEIISYLNSTCHKNFKATEATKRLIRARFNEGFGVDDFKAVVDLKAEEWITDDKMIQYLRPQTLFGTKFEGYREAAGTIETKPKRIWHVQDSTNS